MCSSTFKGDFPLLGILLIMEFITPIILFSSGAASKVTCSITMLARLGIDPSWAEIAFIISEGRPLHFLSSNVFKVGLHTQVKSTELLGTKSFVSSLSLSSVPAKLSRMTCMMYLCLPSFPLYAPKLD